MRRAEIGTNVMTGARACMLCGYNEQHKHLCSRIQCPFKKEKTMTKANEYQVGGDHYSQAGQYQHWDWVAEFNIDYFVGVISKYITRWRKKGQPVQDLEKAIHYTVKLKELALAGRTNQAKVMTTGDVAKFCSANRITSEMDYRALRNIFTWKTIEDLDATIAIVTELLEASPARRIAREYDKSGKTDGQQHPFGYDPEGEAVDDKYKAPGSEGVSEK